MARAAGAKPPLRVPAWVGRLAAGEVQVAKLMMALGNQPGHLDCRLELTEVNGQPGALADLAELQRQRAGPNSRATR